jgi:hypothetical protein
MIRFICDAIMWNLAKFKDMSPKDAAERVTPFLNLALLLQKHPEIIRAAAKAFAIFEPPPSEYEEELSVVQSWFNFQLRIRFKMDLDEFLLFLNRLNRDTRRPDPILKAYLAVCQLNNGKLKPDTVRDYYENGLIRDDAEKKLIAIFNADAERAGHDPIRELRKIDLRFAEEAVAHKQKLHPQRKKQPRSKKPSE